MRRSEQSGEGRFERAAAGLARALRLMTEVADRDVLSRLGPRGMAAVTLPLIALCDALLPRSEALGGAGIPLLWGAVAYYAVRFPLRVSVEPLALGALLAWLASRTSFWSAGAVLLVVACGCGVLRHWLYAEFWPAYAFAAGLVAFCVPAVAVVAGLPSPVHSLPGFAWTVLMAPVTGALAFALLDWFRRRLGIGFTYPRDDEEQYDPSYVYPPYAARGSGI